MGFSPSLIFADLCLITSIGICLFITQANPLFDVKVGLVILAAILFIVAISIHTTTLVKQKRQRRKKK